ncbi:MAG: M23 family metallopeptidase [Chlorobi bacterium]|nr:M23 family metallopeptidase [Chlorobiota bacterium]
MPKTKYKFNSESLSFEPVERTKRQKFWRLTSTIFALLFSAIFLISIFSLFFDLPKEKQLKREITELLTKYELLNKQLDNIETVLGDIQDRDDNIYRVVFETKPIPEAIRKAGIGGINRYKELEGFNNSQIVINTFKKLDQIRGQLKIQSQSYKEVLSMAEKKDEMWSSIPAIQPIADRDVTRFASGFGYRIHPIYKTRKMHTGVDLTAPIGTKVYATGNGTVLKANLSRGGYGKRIIIDHGYGYKTLYGHLSKILVKRGQKVKRGDLIGEVGSTGRSTAPHLHYEVRKNNKAQDPINYYFNDLTPEEYDKMIEISSRPNQSFD